MTNPSSNMSQTDMSTSQEALEAMQPKLSHLHERIMSFIERAGMYGATDAELQSHLLIDPKMNVRTRRKELVQMGLVAVSGFKRKSRDQYGKVISRTANVWVSSRFRPVRAVSQNRLDAADAAEELARSLKKYAKLCRSDAEVHEVNRQASRVCDAERAYTQAKWPLIRASYEAHDAKRVSPPLHTDGGGEDV